jgi:hypothetical protein
MSSSSPRSKSVQWKSKIASYRNVSPRNCDDDIREMKKDLLQYANKLLSKNCCDKDDCDILSEQLQNAQYSCNDMFGKMHSSDSKGNLPETICEKLKDRKIQISRKSQYYRKSRRSMGGKHNRRTHNLRTYNQRTHNQRTRRIY